MVGRAIDVGYGRVKHTLRDQSDPRKVVCHDFPSITLPWHSSDGVFEQGQRGIVKVPVGHVLYAAGPEIRRLQTGGEYGRDLRQDFYRSPVYEALMRGALRFMHDAGDRVIDHLALGLPACPSLFPSWAEHLARHFCGELDVGDGRTVYVRKVSANAHSMGGFFAVEAYGIEDLNRLLAETNATLQGVESLTDHDVLVVDPGEFALDWLPIEKGVLNTRASGTAFDFGRHRVVRAVMGALESKIQRSLLPRTMWSLDEALRTGQPLKHLGALYPLGEFDALIQATLQDSAAMLNDALLCLPKQPDLVVVVGGYHAPYTEAIQRRFPAVPVYVPPNPMFANVLGAQCIAENWMRPAL
jgi:plasmid segregation protein ParM